VRVAPLFLLYQSGLLLNGRAGKHVLKRQLHMKLLVNSSDKRHRLQRVAAKRKKVIVDADLADAKKVRPNLSKPVLRLVRRRLAIPASQPLVRGQRSRVHLPIACQRKLVKKREAGRHHVIRKQPLQSLAN